MDGQGSKGAVHHSGSCSFGSNKDKHQLVEEARNGGAKL